jgi:hypothetical protein
MAQNELEELLLVTTLKPSAILLLQLQYHAENALFQWVC